MLVIFKIKLIFKIILVIFKIKLIFKIKYFKNFIIKNIDIVIDKKE